MIVGVGMVPSKLLEQLRRLVDDPRILLYPEFFDDKKSLLQLKRVKYIEKLLAVKNRVVVALWPDYLYDDPYGLCSLDVIWVFPIHSIEEFERLPRCIDVVGYTGDTSLAMFVRFAKELGLDMWWLGACKKEIVMATGLGFWGVDVNTGSTGLPYKVIGSKDFPKIFADFLKRVANEELRDRQRTLVEWVLAGPAGEEA